MKIRIGIIGLGTVGSGTVEILESRMESLQSQLGLDLEIGALCTIDEAAASTFRTKGYTVTADAEEIINADDIQILAELVGGYDLPLKWIKAALEKGKHVVTANKALIAKHGAELFPIAAKNNCFLQFEAAVGGGIPVIKAMQESLVGNEIQGVSCIINGTCNYIMTEMFQKGGEFDAVLAEAQRLGYAEADPTFDVDGIDSAHKLAILASLSTGTFVDFEKILIEGIRSITPIDIQMAKEMDSTIKLLGVYRQTENGVDARVHPCLLPNSHLLSSVNDVLNAVYVETNNLGPALLTGAGAGKLPTASAVVGDIVTIARSLASGQASPIPMGYYSRENAAELRSMDEVETRYYLRLTTRDQAGVLAHITDVFLKHNISVESMIQKPVEDPEHATIIFTTHTCKEVDVAGALAEIKDLEDCVEAPVMIRFGD